MTVLLEMEGFVDLCSGVFMTRLCEFAASNETFDLGHWLQCYAVCHHASGSHDIRLIPVRRHRRDYGTGFRISRLILVCKTFRVSGQAGGPQWSYKRH